jgi:hypothetical protein
MKKLMMILMVLVNVQSWSQELKDFNLVNVVNGQPISLSTYPSCSGLVIVFTSNACPYDEYYRNRINAIAKSYTDKVPVLLVNSSPDATENNDSMEKKAKQLNLTIPYLADKNQTVMTMLNAKKSPEVFLLKNNGEKFSVVYRGAIDDNPQVEADVRHSYLKDAIDIMLANQTVATPEVRPVGCNLKKK